jgi:non-specific serine/threonine protein kinase
VSSLPADLTSLVGRAREVRDVRAMLGRARLVSLTGPGGVGKTRVALAAARTAERAFPDGVWFVELGALRDPALVEATVTAALGQEQGRGDRSLADQIADWHALLILDNCEHLIVACADLVRDVLKRAPEVRVLVTSREPLGLSGEHVLRIGPFEVPAEANAPAVESLLTTESVQLLVDRAQAIRQDFAVTPANAADVARLCQRLDGLPLTIELAAARLSTMSIRQIADRLDDQSALLTSGPRDAPGRQSSLENTITWSYELCSEAEQQLWARMSVFAGAVDADTVEQVCGFGPELDEVFELLDALVRKSILVCEQGELPRFRMLGAIRQYGRRRLDPAIEQELTERHAAHYASLARVAAEEWYGPDQLLHAEYLRHALPDLRLALDHLLDSDTERGAELVAALYTLWVCHGWFAEGHFWLDRARTVTPPGPALAAVLWLQGWIQLAAGQIGMCRATLDRAGELAAEFGRPDVADWVQALLGVADGFEGKPERGVDLCQGALESRRNAGDLGAAAMFWMFLAEMYYAEGAFARALECADEAVGLCEALGETWCRSYSMVARSFARCGQGDYPRAAEAARAALELKIQLEDNAGILLAAEVICWTMAAAGQWPEAGRLYAAVQPRRDRPATLADFSYLNAQRAAWGEKIRAQLGAEGYAAAEKAGLAMSLEEIGQFALTARPGPPDAAQAPVAARPPLTRRETEVAQLVAEGLSNREIAGRLVISPRTAEVHVERILVKLGFRSRSQVGPWWANP